MRHTGRVRLRLLLISMFLCLEPGSLAYARETNTFEISGVVKDPRADSAVMGATVSTYAANGALLGGDSTDLWGNYRINVDNQYVGAPLYVVGTKAAYTTCSRAIPAAGDHNWATLMIVGNAQWETPPIPPSGGVVGHLGPLDLEIVVPAGTFAEAVTIRGSTVPPIAYSLSGIPAGHYPDGALSLTPYTMAGRKYDGPVSNSVLISHIPDSSYGASAPAPGHVYVLDAGSLGQGGQQLAIGQVQSTAGRFLYSIPHFSVFSLAVGVAGAACGTEPSLSESGEPAKSCTLKSNGGVNCGVYQGASVSITVDADQQIGNVQALASAMSACMGDEKAMAALTAALAASVSTNGAVSLGSSLSFSVAPGQAFGPPCYDGTIEFYLYSETRTLTFGEQSGTVTIPLGIHTCRDLVFSPLCCPPPGAEPATAGLGGLPIQDQQYCCQAGG